MGSRAFPFPAAALLFLLPWGHLHGQPSWWSDPVEPDMTSVAGSLLTPEGIMVQVNIRGVSRILTGWEAVVFLSVRDYLVYDPVSKRYYTTEKYKRWRAQNPRAQAIQGPTTSSGQTASSQVGGGGSPVSQASQWKECELNLQTGSNICGTWDLDLARNLIVAKWSNGAAATMTITRYGGGMIEIVRRDPPSTATPGLTATYSGTIAGRKATGTVSWNWNNRSWTGTWSADL
jgi:hypothetical protein